MSIPPEVQELIREHEARPHETELYYGSEGVRLATADGRTIKAVEWEDAVVVAMHLLRERLTPST